MKDAAQNPSSSFGWKSLSLSQRGAWRQVVVAGVLITVLPLLILAWILKSHLDGAALSTVVASCAGTVIVLVITLGYSLLLKYPVSIVRLREYLSTLAKGEIPDQINLPENENDLVAVQYHMERIVKMAEDRIQLLEIRYQVELQAERQRVMIESIGAMCHHVGQPATVMSMCLYRLKSNPSPQDVPLILAECEAAFDSMVKILEQLRTTSDYSSEPYLHSAPSPLGPLAEPEVRIIKV